MKMKARIGNPFIALALTSVLGLILVGRVTAQTITPISNLNQPKNTVVNINEGAEDGLIAIAISFTTGNAVNYLPNVTISMTNEATYIHPPSTIPINLSLYSDSSGSPGSSLGVLSGNNYPTNSQNYTYTTPAVTLSPNTTYWIVAAETGIIAPPNQDTGYNWNINTNGTLDAGSTWTLGVMKGYDGSGWSLQSGLYPQFSVTVNTNPPSPPALSIFQPIVLTYPATGIPFVLQQNTNLPTTNWVTATNAIQISTVGTNQNVFIVPPNGSQMFYRLQYQ